MAIKDGKSVTNDETVLDHTHLLYLRPSDTPVKLLIQFKLIGTENYNLLSQSMKIELFTKNKIGFIGGKENFRKELHD